jgi:hypothetical protein
MNIFILGATLYTESTQCVHTHYYVKEAIILVTIIYYRFKVIFLEIIIIMKISFTILKCV